MTAIRGPLARLERSRDELAKAWLVRLIERASLDEIRELPTDRIAKELPLVIGDLVAAIGANGGEPPELTEEQARRAATLAELRQGPESSAAELARDVASLQAVLVRALRDEFGDSDPDAFAHAVERLADATGAIQAAAVEQHVQSRSRELEVEANTDALTGLFNLRYLQREIVQLLDFHRRYDQPFALLLMDVDGLKRINDAHGHAAGDRLLMQVAVALRRSIRAVDTPARMGGDEFCVLAPNQDAKHAFVLAERLAQAVEGEVAAPDDAPVRLSIGVVCCPEHGDNADALLDLADKAMYRAKAGGEGVAMAENGVPAVAEEAKPTT
jgi:two-component system cell cycle response regulator